MKINLKAILTTLNKSVTKVKANFSSLFRRQPIKIGHKGRQRKRRLELVGLEEKAAGAISRNK